MGCSEDPLGPRQAFGIEDEALEREACKRLWKMIVTSAVERRACNPLIYATGG